MRHGWVLFRSGKSIFQACFKTHVGGHRGRTSLAYTDVFERAMGKGKRAGKPAILKMELCFKRGRGLVTNVFFSGMQPLRKLDGCLTYFLILVGSPSAI